MRSVFSVPASFFAMILGLIGLGNCWRVAARIWGLPHSAGEAIMALAVFIWALLVLLYVGKWIWRRADARAEFNHPVQCCFIGLAPVSTMLTAVALLPYSRPAAAVIGAVGAAGQLGFAIYRTGHLWTGGRDPLTTTPVLYLPTVAGSFVSAVLAALFGLPDVAAMFFGAGLFGWLAVESVLLHRLYVHAPLAPPLRPTLGIQIAPAVVGCGAYLAITTGPPDIAAKALLGYGLLQTLVIARLLPWIMAQPFGAGYWAFTFGITAMAFDAMRFVERGAGQDMVVMAWVLFAMANLVVGTIALGTLWLTLRGRILPPPIVVAAA